MSIEIRTECTAAYSGQSNLTDTAFVDGHIVGHLDYVIFRGCVSISHIDVLARRQGVASMLLARLQREYAGQEIDWGLLTDEGSHLYKAIPFLRVARPEVLQMRDELACVESRLQQYQVLSDEYAKGPKTQDLHAKFIADVARWNDDRDRAEQIQEALLGQRDHYLLIDHEAICAAYEARAHAHTERLRCA